MMKHFKIAAMALLIVTAATSGTAWAASLEEKKELSARAIGMWGSGDFSLVGETFTESYVNHQEPDVDGGPKSIDLKPWTELAKRFHEAFSDTKVEILLQLGEGDLVATRWRFTGAQTGTYLGLAPTDKIITWTGTQVDRFEDGKIAETWVNWDMYSMFKQLGLLE